MSLIAVLCIWLDYPSLKMNITFKISFSQKQLNAKCYQAILPHLPGFQVESSLRHSVCLLLRVARFSGKKCASHAARIFIFSVMFFLQQHCLFLYEFRQI
jgi:hypothetical protein